MTLALVPEASDEAQPKDTALVVVSDAAGRMRVQVGWVRCDSRRAVAVEEAVAKQNGVRAVHAYPHTGSVVVWYSPPRCDRSSVLAAISSAAHVAAELIPARAPHSSEIRNSDVLRMVIGGAALALLGVRRSLFARPPLLGPSGRLVATGVTIFTGYPFLRGALGSLRSGKAGTDALVSAATVASLILRENVVALTVLWLLNIGEYLQDLTLRRTRRAISELLRGSQDTAWIRLADGPRAGTEIQVPIDTVQIGDEVVVHDHVAIPVDGEVVDGEAIVDQSAITGENLPVSVTVCARVHAGSVVVRGRLVVRAHAVGNQTTIGRIIARVEEAQHDRAPIQTVGENFSRRFVPTSFIVSAVTLAITGDVRRAMTMLLIACPCAVGLSTPTAISAAIGNGARRGILIKGGSHLEQAGRVDAIVFDKTGTLTVGRPVVTNIVAMHKDWEPEQVLAYAASSEIHSRHPLAEAVIRSTEERRISIPPHEECEVLVGLGMRTWADGRTLLLGSPSLLRAEKGEGVEEGLGMGGQAAPPGRDPAAARGRRHAGRADQPARRSAARGRRGAEEVAGQRDSPDRHAHRGPSRDRPGRRRRTGDRRVARRGDAGGQARGGARAAGARASSSAWSATASTTPRRWRPPISGSPWVWPEPTSPSRPPMWRWPTTICIACSTCGTWAPGRSRSSARTTACPSPSTPPGCSSARAARSHPCWPRSCTTHRQWRWWPTAPG